MCGILNNMLDLSIQERTQLKKRARTLLQQGSIPAVLYGPKLSPQTISVSAHDFHKVYKEVGETSLISLVAQENAKKEVALIRSLQRDVGTGQVIHIDFYQPPLDKTVEVTIPIQLEGSAPAVDDLGGVLMRSLHEVSIRALPEHLINEIVVDISKLETLDGVITIADITPPAEVEVINEPSTAIVFIKSPLQQEQEAREDAAAEKAESSEEGDAISEIKTEGEEKREEKQEEQGEQEQGQEQE